MATRGSERHVAAVILLSFLFLLHPASAYEITDLQLLGGGQPVEYVSPSHEQVVELSFTVEAPAVAYVDLDLSALHADPGRAATLATTRVMLSGCQRNSSANRSSCRLANLRIKPPSESVEIPYTIHYAGGQFPGSLTRSFQLDGSAPTVTRIATQLCTENACYAGSGTTTRVTIELEDESGSFNKGLLFFSLGGRTFQASNCSGSTCTGEAIITCGDEAPLDLKVANGPGGVPSQDDAGNPVANPGEVVRVWCDANAPVVESITANGTDLFGLISNAGELLIHAKVRDMVTTVTMRVNTSSVQQNVSPDTILATECVREENDLQSCGLTISNLQDGRDFLLPITFTDEVGHETTAQISIPLILKMANASTKPDFFTGEATRVSPERINRVALQLALENAFDYPQFITYELSRKSSGARILQQEMDPTECQAVTSPEGRVANPYGPNPAQNWSGAATLYQETRVFYPNADWEEENRVDATFLDLETEELAADTILVRCNLSLYVEKDDVLYAVPEEETLYWPVRLKNSALGTPGEAFLGKMDEQKEELESGILQLIGHANQLMATMAHLCEFQSVINMLTAESISMEGIALACMQTGVCGSIAQTGNQQYNRYLQASMAYWLGKSKDGRDLDPGRKPNEQGGVGWKMCNYVYCHTADKMKEEGAEGNWFLSGDQPWAEEIDGQMGDNAAFGLYFQNLNQPDVKNSLLMSFATQCWGGVVSNLNKYRQIECGYLACLREQASAGASVAPCEAGKGTYLCQFVMGEVFELPYLRVINNLLDNVQTIMQAPLGLLWNYLDNTACQGKDTEITWPGFFCHLMKGIQLSKDFAASTQQSQLFTFDASADICQRALCEGDECGYRTSSWLEEIAPGAAFGGVDAYRQEYFDDREEEIRKRENKKLVGELREWDGEEEITREEYPELHRYGRSHVDGDIEDFFTHVRAECGNTQEGCIKNFQWMLSQGRTPGSTDEFDQFNGDTSAQANAKPYGAFNEYYEEITKNDDYECTEDGCTPKNCDNAADDYCTELRRELNRLEKAMGDNKPCKQGRTWVLCPGSSCPPADGSYDDCATRDDTTAGDAADEAARKAENAANFYGWVEMIGRMWYEDERAQGGLDWMTMEGWGSMGEEIHSWAEEMPLTTTWAQSLCNPTGEFGDLTEDDGVVYALQGNQYRAVLTFAGEKLPIQERATGEAPRYLYTVSYVVVSPHGDNQFTVSLQPGDKRLTEEPVRLSQGNTPASDAFSLIDETEYQRVCITFTQPYPDASGDREYCRDIAVNAYERGGVTNETLPEWGTDPYSPPSSETIGAGGSLGGLFG